MRTGQTTRCYYLFIYSFYLFQNKHNVLNTYQGCVQYQLKVVPMWPCHDRFLFFIEAQLIYNVILVSDVQQSDPAVHSCMCVQSVYSCLTLYNFMNCSSPGSSVHGILQVRILEWISMLSSKESSRPRDGAHVSYISCTAGGFFYPLSHLGSSQLYTQMYILFFRLFSIIGYYKILNIVPCVIQQVLVVHVFYI